MEDLKTVIAARAAKELKDGDVVNLGIGLPTMVANYLPEEVNIVLQAEHGMLGMGAMAKPGKEDVDIVNAGGQYVSINPGAMFFDSSTSFGIIRGGHVDVSILGSLEVDAEGNLANWIVPGKLAPGMGGAMDLVVGAKKVIVAMLHTQKGKTKILTKCTLPFTAVRVVDLIITEMGVIDVTSKGLVLKEINPAFTVEQVQAATEAVLTVSPDLKSML
ncbi:MAG: 3-oxoacid CoA-transferase subunit B [Treponema sp.]|jgi:acetate CoA/acetoacetate CoA-transferase beta subunit|nr:3-oxoacid CoA-transferase subunit B [Treponema sp.]